MSGSENLPFARIVDALPDAIVAVDRDGRIRLVNRQAESLFGYGRDELLGASIELLLPERLKPSHAAQVASYVAEPRTRPMGTGLDLTARRKDGTEVPVDISLSPLDTDDGVLVAAAIRDVSERKRADEERARVEARLDAAQRLQSLGELAGGIAHDFDSVLAVILDHAAFVADEIRRLAPESELVQDVDEIRVAAERAAALTHELLVLGRREVGSPEVLDVNVLVRALEQSVRRTIGEHVELAIRLGDRVGLVRADPSAIEQVLMSLVVNARDAMPSGGSLVIATSDVEISADTARVWADLEEGGYVLLVVADTGAGMDRDVVARAFDPFFTTKADGRRTGLGLPTVHRIARDAGGDIQLCSQPGWGTSVRVYLPAVAAEIEPAREPPATAVPGTAGETILVVSDEDPVRRLAERVLAREGYAVIAARDRRGALVAAAEHPGSIDLLLTDVVMQGTSGAALAAELVVARPEVRVACMSGYPREVMPESARIEGATLIETPFTAPDLLVLVRRVLDEPASPPVSGSP